MVGGVSGAKACYFAHPTTQPKDTCFRSFSHGVAAAGSPRREPWDMLVSKLLAPTGRQRGSPRSTTRKILSPLPGLGIIVDSHPYGLRHRLPAVTPTGVEASAIRLATNAHLTQTSSISPRPNLDGED